jgi:hypothetical protein
MSFKDRELGGRELGGCLVLLLSSPTANDLLLYQATLKPEQAEHGRWAS